MAVPDVDELPVSLTEPIIPQLLSLPSTAPTKAAYMRWGRDHVPGRLTLFASPTLELLSHTPFYGPLVAWIPVIAVLLATLVLPSGLSLPRTLSVLLLGVLLWSFLEYTLHRFLFHMDEWMPPSSTLFALHFIIHGVHHKTPGDSLRLVFPPAASLAIGLVIAFLFSPLLALVGTAQFAALYAGGAVGYVSYEMIHYSTHHVHVRKGPSTGPLCARLCALLLQPLTSAFRALQRLHMRHHVVHTSGFGVSSPLWDVVFGTTVWREDMARAAAAAKGEGVRQGRGKGE